MEIKGMVERFFEYSAALHEGDESVVEKLLDLFDEDASWEFLGRYPLVGKFRGRMALHVLFKNQAQAAAMTIPLEARKEARISKISPVVVQDTVADGGKAVVNWDQWVHLDGHEAFPLTGCTTFYFKHGKIGRVTGIVLPRRDVSDKALPAEMSLADLTVDDIGRLALAAWPVV